MSFLKIGDKISDATRPNAKIKVLQIKEDVLTVHIIEKIDKMTIDEIRVYSKRAVERSIEMEMTLKLIE